MVRKNILYWADFSSQGRTKISFNGTPRPTNQPRKDPFHLSSLSPHFLQFQQSAGATPLWSPVSQQRQASTCFTVKRKAMTWKTKVAILAVLIDVERGFRASSKREVYFTSLVRCVQQYKYGRCTFKGCEK